LDLKARLKATNLLESAKQDVISRITREQVVGTH